MAEVTISLERYDQLIRAEQDANVLKGIIASKVERFGGLSLDELRVLDDSYNGASE